MSQIPCCTISCNSYFSDSNLKNYVIVRKLMKLPTNCQNFSSVAQVLQILWLFEEKDHILSSNKITCPHNFEDYKSSTQLLTNLEKCKFKKLYDRWKGFSLLFNMSAISGPQLKYFRNYDCLKTDTSFFPKFCSHSRSELQTGVISTIFKLQG